MAISLGNRAKMSTSTTGTGTITLGSAEAGYQTFAAAGITNGQTVRYVVEDGSNFEIGSGTYTSSGTTLTRSVTESSNSDNAIVLSGAAKVFLSATVADLYINDGATSLTTTGVGTFASLDISGDVDVDGTLEADAITIGGTAVGSIFSPIAGGTGIVTTGALDAGSITSGFGAINNGSSAITTTGVITGGTLEATTDTAAGDNAAIGYTAAEGLILTGQGSTSDITLKNDADAVVFTVPTGTDDILFPDNAKILMGAGSDLQLFHNGSQSYIGDYGTGDLNIQGTDVKILSNDSELMADFNVNGAVELYHNNALKIATTATGVDVTGNVIATGTVEPAGDTAAGDNAAIGYTAAEGLILTGQGSTSDITFKNDADATVFSIPTGTDDILFPDNAKAIFGTGSDLEISHNGSASIIKDVGTGGLTLSSNGYAVLCYDNANSNNMAEFITGAGTKLYYNGNLKFEVKSTGVDITGAATVGSAAVKVAGKESIYVPAAAMYPSTTNPCSDITQVETTALRPDLKVLDFSDGADDFAQFSVAFPKSWNEGTVTFQPFWTVTGTNTGTVAWQLAAVAITNDESINTAFGTQVATTALAFSGTSNDLMVSAESGAVTIAGSPAANDMCFFQINRDVSADTQSGAARLLGVKLFFTTDAANDA